MGSTVHIFSMFTTISLLLSATVLLVRAEDLEEVSDPRLFFANVTSSLLPVNLTIAAYGAAVILGGSVLGLVLYFLATQARPRYHGYQHYNQYGYGYGESDYVDRMDQARSFDILGLIGNALNMYQERSGQASHQARHQEQKLEHDY